MKHKQLSKLKHSEDSNTSMTTKETTSITSYDTPLSDTDSITTLNLTDIDGEPIYYNYSEEDWEQILQKDSTFNHNNVCLQGLGTNFQSSKLKNAPKGSNELECFINDLAKELLRRAFSQKKGEEEIHPKFPLHEDISKFISDLIRDLKSTECMMVPTDKTNGYIVMERDEYILEMEESLAKVSNPINVSSVKRFKAEAAEILESFKLDMSQKEYEGVNQLLMSCAVPTPKLLVKDHKPLKESGRYPC